MIVHIHVPKTGGTTLRTVLEQEYEVYRPRGPRGQGDAAWGLVEHVRDGVAPPAEVVSGHIPLGVRDYLHAETRYITVLRHPVQRALSHYLAETRPEIRTGNWPPFGSTLAAGRHVLDNLFVRYLSGSLDVFDEPATETMRDAALENLGGLEFGFLNHIDAFITGPLGLSPVPPQRVGEEVAEPPRDVLDAACEANHLDLELWEYANAVS